VARLPRVSWQLKSVGRLAALTVLDDSAAVLAEAGALRPSSAPATVSSELQRLLFPGMAGRRRMQTLLERALLHQVC
jgi:hypothetical protein